MIEPVEQTDLYRTTVDIRAAGMIIPKGTTTDGASIPSLLWGMIHSPFHPRVIIAAIYHDYMYRVSNDRMAVDRAFYKMLLRAGVSRGKAAAIYRGVRVFGGRYFRRLRK